MALLTPQRIARNRNRLPRKTKMMKFELNIELLNGLSVGWVGPRLTQVTGSLDCYHTVD